MKFVVFGAKVQDYCRRRFRNHTLQATQTLHQSEEKLDLIRLALTKYAELLGEESSVLRRSVRDEVR